jgi:chromosome segregation protein
MAGFKSFAEVAEVEIESGMTGIVGPNGCGKSNVVEGLRWVMGESNARQMRGGEMDDLIFSGTDQRPARNLAEITLNLDNSRRVAPAEFNNDDDIEITRKIERGKGSSYFVNAKPARAKDVQLLFADSATGARSSGMVSQGRIGAIVGAKPNDRRALLEEAANITGLHSRRHEAELRLRGAETNLERLDDVIAGLTEQRDSLRKQSGQPLPFGRRPYSQGRGSASAGKMDSQRGKSWRIRG